jgi:hypothetical protein
MPWNSQVVDAVAQGLTPLLRTAGFKKRGRMFVRYTSEGGVLLHVQASSANDASQARFTINLAARHDGVQNLMDWSRKAQHLSLRDCIIQRRIGHLMDVKRDFWWIVEPQMNLDAIVGEVRETVELCGLPFLERVAEWDEARRILLAEPSTFRAFFVHLFEGNPALARQCFSDLNGPNAGVLRTRARRAATKAGLDLPDAP